MTRLVALAAMTAMLLPLSPDAAVAHPAPYPHAHEAPRGHRAPPVRRRVVRKRVVRRPAPRPRRVIVRPAPRTVVVRERRRPVVVVQPAPVIHAAPAPPERRRMSLGVRGLVSTVDGDKAGLSTAENPSMGGLGFQFRTRFSRRVGLELSSDFLRGSGPDFSQRTVPLMGALTVHLRPDARLQPYVLAGAGVHLTRLEYLDGQFRTSTAEVAGQLGGGVELFLTERFSLQADVRGQTIFKSVDSQAEIREDCLRQVGSLQGFCDGIHSAEPDDKMNLGIQFQLGANFHF